MSVSGRWQRGSPVRLSPPALLRSMRKGSSPRITSRRCEMLVCSAWHSPRSMVARKLVRLAIAIEELGKYDCWAGLMLLTTRLATTCIALAGTPAQKDRYLRGVGEGQLRGCFALTEPETGSDAADITTSAIRDGDGYVLNGIKLWAGQATVADCAVVVAVSRPGAGAQGVSVFVVDLPHCGLRIVRELAKMEVL